MDNSAEAKLAEEINSLWDRFLPQLKERVATLEEGAAQLANGTLSEENRLEVSATAHKLAGALGMFGLNEGSQLARETENFYAGRVLKTPDSAERMVEIAALLRMMLAAERSSYL